VVGGTLTGSALLAAIAALGAQPIALRAGDHYVAMGSSFAAGPGIPDLAPGSPARCGRSTSNYANLLARQLSLTLTDVSCSGATTADLLEASGDLPSQSEAITGSTRLVTLTIGGNDVGYIANLGADACAHLKLKVSACPARKVIEEDRWLLLERSLIEIVRRVRARSAHARIVFVDYLAIVPTSEVCSAIPLSTEGVERSREVARRVNEATRRAAKQAGAELLAVSKLSTKHHACSKAPWTTGLSIAGGKLRGVPFHPNRAGMEAVTEALRRHLQVPGKSKARLPAIRSSVATAPMRLSPHRSLSSSASNRLQATGRVCDARGCSEQRSAGPQR
jgi:lysophospholipase L1-like esterase